MYHLEEYEIAIIQGEIGALKEKHKILGDMQQRLYDAISKRVGYRVDGESIRHISLPQHVWHDIYDEIYDKHDALIKPSHDFKEYSLYNKKPEFAKYLPQQSIFPALHSESTKRAFEIICEYSSKKTYEAYSGDIVYWHAWLSALGSKFEEPVSIQDVITFIVQHVEAIDHEVDCRMVSQGYKSRRGPHKLATVKRRIASLSVFLDSVKWPNVCHAKEVKLLLSKLTKRYGASKPRGKAITKDILDDMLDTCKDKLIDLRDKALLLFAWGTGGRRRGEVSSALMHNLTRTPGGEFVYEIPFSKTDQQGKGYTVPVNGRVAVALQAWLDASGIKEGHIFRGFRKGDKISKPLASDEIHRIVRKRLKMAGYNELLYTAHSIRSGFVTTCGRRNIPLGDVMQMTTHKSIPTVMKYYQAGHIVNNLAARLAD